MMKSIQTITLFCAMISICPADAMHIISRHAKHNSLRTMAHVTQPAKTENTVIENLNAEQMVNGFASTMNICAPFLVDMAHAPFYFVLPVIPQIVHIGAIALTKRQLKANDGPKLIKDLALTLERDSKRDIFGAESGYANEIAQIFENYKNVNLEQCIQHSEKCIDKPLSIEKFRNLHTNLSICLTGPTVACSALISLMGVVWFAMGEIDGLVMVVAACPGFLSGIIAFDGDKDFADELLRSSKYKHARMHTSILALLKQKQAMEQGKVKTNE